VTDWLAHTPPEILASYKIDPDHLAKPDFALDFESWLAEQPRYDGPAVPQPMNMIYTSGTTGLSKGVCCPHAQFFWWGLNTSYLLGIGEDDILCTTLPLFHTNALNSFFQALIAGATVSYEPNFSASGFFEAYENDPRSRVAKDECGGEWC